MCCGYSKLHSALETHHLDPHVKEVALGDLRANIRAWQYMVVELRKCVLVCVRCHMEIHAGVTLVPENAPRFDESFSEYRVKVAPLTDACPVCGRQKSIKYKTCSLNCAGSLANKVDWSDLPKLLKTMNRSQIADHYDVSWTAVAKQIKKRCLTPEVVR